MLDEPAVTPARRDHAAGAGEREFKFGQADFRAIAAVLREDAGINLPDGKAPLVYARLVKRLRVLGLTNFADYVTLLRGPDAHEERRFMLTALTTNVTRFFREPHHFDHLRANVILPLAQSHKGERVRFWSAACSTGQEPYSMAAVLADSFPGASRGDVKILASDIDPNVLEQAKTGRYESIDGVPPDMRRWFERDGAGWIVDPALRALISFRCLNLNAKWPFRGPFDAIFCRNVAIYFDQEVQSRLWMAFAGVMQPGSTLCIGHSERVNGPAASMFDNIGITTYRRRSTDA